MLIRLRNIRFRAKLSQNSAPSVQVVKRILFECSNLRSLSKMHKVCMLKKFLALPHIVLFVDARKPYVMCVLTIILSVFALTITSF